MGYIGTPCLGRRKDFFFLKKKKKCHISFKLREIQDDDFGDRMDCMGRPSLGRGLNVRNHLSVGFQCQLF